MGQIQRALWWKTSSEVNRNQCRQLPQQNRSSPNILTAGQPSSSGDGRLFVGRWTRRRRNEENLSKKLINETIDTRWMPLKVSKILRQLMGGIEEEGKRKSQKEKGNKR